MDRSKARQTLEWFIGAGVINSITFIYTVPNLGFVRPITYTMPIHSLTLKNFREEIWLLGVVMNSGLAVNMSNARRSIQKTGNLNCICGCTDFAKFRIVQFCTQSYQTDNSEKTVVTGFIFKKF